MKKFFLIAVTALFGFSMQSCVSSDDDVIYTDHDTYSAVYQLNNINFEWTSQGWRYYRTFSPALYQYDMVMVYIQNGTNSNGAPIWQQIPITYYLDDGNEVDYNFDFSIHDIMLYTGGTFDMTGTSFVQNRTFRILVIPADPPAKNAGGDLSDYQSVVDYYKIDDSKVVNLN